MELPQARPDITLLERALAWLADHLDSSARQITRAIGERDDRWVFRLLDRAAYDGRCQRWRPHPRSAWLWEVPSGPSAPRQPADPVRRG